MRNRWPTKAITWPYRGPGPGPCTTSLPTTALPRIQHSPWNKTVLQMPNDGWKPWKGKGQQQIVHMHLCHLGLACVKSRTWRSSVESPAGPMPPCQSMQQNLWQSHQPQQISVENLMFYEYVNVQIWAWKAWVWSILEVLLPKWLLYSNSLHCTVCFGSTFTIASITIFSTTDQSKTRSLIELCLSTEGRVANWISLNTCSKLFVPTFTLFLSYLNCYHGTHSCGCMSSTWRWWISNRNQPACKEGANRL